MKHAVGIMKKLKVKFLSVFPSQTKPLNFLGFSWHFLCYWEFEWCLSEDNRLPLYAIVILQKGSIFLKLSRHSHIITRGWTEQEMEWEVV